MRGERAIIETRNTIRPCTPRVSSMPERRASVAPLRPAVRRLVVAVLGVWLATAPAASAAGQVARITLLPVGSRASLVVEIDDAVTTATAIEATDDRAVAVEIGPVRGRVRNQLLQAPGNSPLVSQVRVRGVTHGNDGTVITIYVTAKTPVSGSVRQAPGRVYIDLVPRDASRAAAPDSRDTTARQRAQPAAPVPVRQAPVPATTTATRSPGNAAGPSASREPPPALTDVENRAAEYAGKGDVRSLERLKTELQVRRATAVAAATDTTDVDTTITHVDWFAVAARQNRLAADAALFNDLVAESVTDGGGVGAHRAPVDGASHADTSRRRRRGCRRHALCRRRTDCVG